MDTQDLTPTMQELKAELAAMRAALSDLEARADLITTPPAQPVKSSLTTSRRKTLRRLGLALLGGAATATALGETSTVQAKASVHPSANGMANRVGMLVVPPGAPNPTGSITSTSTYGLIGCGDKTSSLDTTFFPTGSTGVVGTGTGDGKAGTGVAGYGSYGVYGVGNIYGVYGQGTSRGVVGYGDNTGVVGNSPKVGVSGSGSIAGGDFSGGDNGYGVGATAGSSYLFNNLRSNTSVGLVATAGKRVDLNNLFSINQNVGLYATADDSSGRNPTAAYFDGRVAVIGNLSIQGNLSKSSGTFKIDHPLNPENQYLYHSFVESPDMLNIYTGLVTLDQQGEAVIELPTWFEALNRDFRYQLTCLGQYAGVYIASEIKDRKFKVAGGLDGLKVSWQVTGIRQDEWAKAHPIQVEEDKTGPEKGKYLHPEVFGKPERLKIGGLG